MPRFRQLDFSVLVASCCHHRLLLSWWHALCYSDARDKVLYALGRLLDSLVDVLTMSSGDEGIDVTIRDEFTAKLGTLLKGAVDDEDLFASRTVRWFTV